MALIAKLQGSLRTRRDVRQVVRVERLHDCSNVLMFRANEGEV